MSPAKLVLWNEKSEQQVIQICEDGVVKIKRVLASNYYIIRTYENAVKVLKMQIPSNYHPLEYLLDINSVAGLYDESISLLASDSQIIVAAAQN